MTEQETQAQTTEQKKKVIKIEATTAADKVPEANREYADENGRIGSSFLWNPGSDIEDAVERYGHDNVFDLYASQAVVKAQAAIRRELEAGTPPDEIGDKLDDWRPDVQHRTSADPVQKALKAADDLENEEELDALMKQIRARKAKMAQQG